MANLDPGQSDNNCIILRWERHALRYINDIEIYMREPQQAFSPTHRVEMRFWRTPSARPSTNENIMLISFGDYASLHTFTRTRKQFSKSQTDASSPGQIWCTESEVLLSIYALLEVVVSDTVNFLQECSVELELMVSNSTSSLILSRLSLQGTSLHKTNLRSVNDFVLCLACIDVVSCPPMKIPGETILHRKLRHSVLILTSVEYQSTSTTQGEQDPLSNAS